jgi:O-antigen ligase
MSPRLRTLVVASAAAVAAVWLGAALARGAYAGPALAAALALGIILTAAARLPLDALAVGGVLAGYIVGNRGFAQLMPAPGLPLFPAEIALGLAGTWLAIRCALARRPPVARDGLNLAVVAWLALGTVRLAFDLPRFGVLAVRDYAMVYYALFFFVAQDMNRRPAARRLLRGCLLAGFAVLPLVHALYQAFPDVFLSELTVRGLPVIFFKGDLAGTFLGAASVLLFFQPAGRLQPWTRLLSAGLFVYVFAGGNRASMLGLAIVTALLLAARRWRFPLWQSGATAGAAALVLALAVFVQNPWAGQKLGSVTDRFLSLADFRGTQTYASEENASKGDNNRFRWVWWRNVAEETWHANPVFGQGFGADLSRGFVQEYYPVAEEEFTTRSPHNIFVTAFGRMGLAGLAVWTALAGLVGFRAWRTLRTTEDPVGWAWACILCLILVSASLGVVLEGPMAAVVFWTLLGLAQGARPEPADDPAAPAGEAGGTAGATEAAET